MQSIAEKVLARVPRGLREEIRISVVETKGHRSLDVRVFERARGRTEGHPTPRGFRMRVGDLENFRDALSAAHERLLLEDEKGASAPAEPPERWWDKL